MPKNKKPSAKGFSADDWGVWEEQPIPTTSNFTRVVSNRKYSVGVEQYQDADGPITKLYITPTNRQPVRSAFSDFQRIKNELLGPEYCCVQVFPPESQLVDAVNAYHLWVWPDHIPWQFNLRRSLFMAADTQAKIAQLEAEIAALESEYNVQ